MSETLWYNNLEEISSFDFKKELESNLASAIDIKLAVLSQEMKSEKDIKDTKLNLFYKFEDKDLNKLLKSNGISFDKLWNIKIWKIDLRERINKEFNYILDKDSDIYLTFLHWDTDYNIKIYVRIPWLIKLKNTFTEDNYRVVYYINYIIVDWKIISTNKTQLSRKEKKELIL